MTGIKRRWGPPVACLALVMLLAAGAIADPVYEKTARWAAPSFGTAVVYYEVQISVDEGTWSAPVRATGGTSHTFQLDLYHSYRIRVRGVDAQQVRGPYSVPSPPYVLPAGIPAPGPNQPGKPGGGFAPQ